MKSLRVKLVSLIAMLCLVFGLVVVGIYAAEIQYINLGGSITFSVDDKSLYVQDVKMQEDNFSNSYSLKEQGKFIPGYINGEFNMNLGEFNNDYGSFKLMFDIINTVDEEGNTNMYNVSATSEQEGVYVQAVVDNDEGYIPFGSITPADISSDTLPTATIVLTVTCPAVSEVDLSQISITITRREPQVLSDFDFEVDEQAMTARLTEYYGAGGEVVIPSTISVVDNGDGTQSFVEGTDYTVTEIGDSAFYGEQSITSITIPENIELIINDAFYGLSDIKNIYYNAINSSTQIYDAANSGGIFRDSNIENFIIGDCVEYIPAIFISRIEEDNHYSYDIEITVDNIYIGKNVSSISEFAFSGLENTKNIYVDPENQYYTSRDNEGNEINCLIEIASGTLLKATDNTSMTEGSYLYNTITSLGTAAFAGLDNITFDFSPNITSISSLAFKECQFTETSMVIPERVTYIGYYAFEDVEGLETITFEVPRGWNLRGNGYSNSSLSAATLSSNVINYLNGNLTYGNYGYTAYCEWNWSAVV